MNETQGGRGAIRIALMAHVRLFREGLALALSECPRVVLVWARPVTPAGIEEALRVEADVLLVDTGVEDLISVVETFRARAPFTRVIVFVMGGDDGAIIRSVEAGVAGYVGGDATIEELVSTIERVHHGEFACTSRVALLLADQLRAFMQRDRTEPVLHGARDELTLRERQVAELIERGLSNKEIANTLGIGLSTVKHHVHNILGKSAATRRGQVRRVQPDAPSWRIDRLIPPKGI